MGQYIEPPLAEVAAWLSTRSPAFRQHLLGHEPGLLLRADIARLALADKRALVDRLLAQARAGSFFDRWNERRYYQGLGHSNLAGQLRPWIRDPSIGINARRLALTIAAACRCHAVFDDVFSCVSDPADASFHSACAFALAKLSRRRDAPRLIGVITQEPGIAERQVRLGCALGLLETKAWTLRDVAPHLSRIVTARSTDVHLLAQYCAQRDVPFILSEALRWPGAFDVGSMYYSLTRAGFRAAIEAWHRPAMRLGLAKLWLASTATFGAPDDLMRAIATRAKTDEAGRRALIEVVSGLRILSGHELHCLIGRMLVETDLLWMLERVRALLPVAQRNFAAAIRALYCRNYPPEFFDVILAVRKVVPALGAEFDWLRTWQLDEPAALAAKEFHAQSQAAAPATERIDPTAVWQRDLRTLQHGSTKGWVWASHNLFVTGENQGMSELEADVARAPGWEYHSASARRSMREAARRMLLAQSGEPNFSLNQLGQWGVAGYRAIVLLRATMSRDSALRAAVRRHWIPTILNWFGSDEGRARQLVRLAYRLDRHRFFRFLDDELAHVAVSQEGLAICLRKYAACWNHKLGDHVRQWVMRYPQLRPQLLASLMRELREIEAGLALQLCEQAFASPAFTKDRKAALLGAWLETEIWGSWEQVKKMLNDPDVARAAFLAAAVHYDVEARRIPKRIKATMLEELYLKLRFLFPIADDDSIPNQSYTPTPRMDVAQWRNRLPQILAAQATVAACRALLRLIASSEGNERTWLQMRLLDAIESKRRQEWRPATADELRVELSRAS